MNDIWIDLSKIVVFEKVTLYQLLGLATVILASVNVFLYSVAVSLVWKTTHHITQSLKNKFILESLMMCATVLMGFGALLDTDKWYWQVSYVCRVGLLLIAPFILWRVIVACKTIINANKDIE